MITIIQAWRRAGSPYTNVPSIANYNGAWSEYCPHPLIWLGFPDPAIALIEQINHDPDGDALKELMLEWNHIFGHKPTTVRKVIDYTRSTSGANFESGLMQALLELPVVDNKGNINPSKLGWFLRKNANRIIDGYEFQKCEADGRTAWRLVYVNSADSPPPFEKRVEDISEEDDAFKIDE